MDPSAPDDRLATLEPRLRDKIQVTATCWHWTGFHDPDGYGRSSRDGKTYQAHRLIYELLVGPVPEGLTLDHLCSVRTCVRPSHLEPVTQAENVARASWLAPIARSGDDGSEGVEILTYPEDEAALATMRGIRIGLRAADVAVAIPAH